MPERCATVSALMARYSIVEILESRRLLSAGPHGHGGAAGMDDGAIVVSLNGHDQGQGHDDRSDENQQQSDSGQDDGGHDSWSDDNVSITDQGQDGSGHDGDHGQWDEGNWNQEFDGDSNQPTTPPGQVISQPVVVPPVEISPPVDVVSPPSGVTPPPVTVSPPHWKVTPPPENVPPVQPPTTSPPPVEQPPSTPPPVDQPPTSAPPVEQPPASQPPVTTPPVTTPPVTTPPVNVTPPANSPPPVSSPVGSTTPPPVVSAPPAHEPSAGSGSSEHSAPSSSGASGSGNASASSSGQSGASQSSQPSSGSGAAATNPPAQSSQPAAQPAPVVSQANVSAPSEKAAPNAATTFSRVQIQESGANQSQVDAQHASQQAPTGNALERLMKTVFGDSPYGHVHGAVAAEAMSVPVSADEVQVRSIGDLLSTPPQAQLSSAMIAPSESGAQPQDLGELVRPPQQQASFRAAVDRDGAINPQNVMAAILAGVTLGAIQLHRWRKRRVEAAAAAAQKLASLLSFDPLAVWVDNPRRRRRY